MSRHGVDSEPPPPSLGEEDAPPPPSDPPSDPPRIPMYKESVRGVIRSADASSGAEIDLFQAGSDTVRPLLDGEFLTVNSIFVSIGAGNGDVRVQFGDGTAANATTIFRGSLAANGHADVQFGQGMSGPRGLAPHVISPAGDIDVILTGHITRA